MFILGQGACHGSTTKVFILHKHESVAMLKPPEATGSQTTSGLGIGPNLLQWSDASAQGIQKLREARTIC